MITRVRDNKAETGFIVSTWDDKGLIEARETDDLEAAFAMQKAVQETGKWPDGKEPSR
jgi:hypothetical protein